MLDIADQYKARPEGEEIPDEELGLENLKNALRTEYRYLESSQTDRRVYLQRAHNAQQSEDKSLKRINLLKKTIDDLLKLQ